MEISPNKDNNHLSEDQIWLENFTAEKEHTSKNQKLQKTVFELNKKAYQKGKLAFDEAKRDFEECKREINKSQHLSILIEKSKFAIERQKRDLERIRYAEFLMEFAPIDSRIVGIPALVKAQEIVMLTPDPNFPIDCEDNVVARLDWDISNNDILISENFLNTWIQHRINYAE